MLIERAKTKVATSVPGTVCSEYLVVGMMVMLLKLETGARPATSHHCILMVFP